MVYKHEAKFVLLLLLKAIPQPVKSAMNHKKSNTEIMQRKKILFDHLIRKHK